MTDGTEDALRVVQWTTGNVAVEVVKALLNRPDFVLVGAYAYSADKVGVDVDVLPRTPTTARTDDPRVVARDGLLDRPSKLTHVSRKGVGR